MSLQEVLLHAGGTLLLSQTLFFGEGYSGDRNRFPVLARRLLSTRSAVTLEEAYHIYTSALRIH
jgi:hypothetical protein